MATNSSGIARLIPKSQCIPWIIVLIMESLSVVILNLLIVIVFAKLRQLQRRGTYLLIRNLAIVDLLAGGISGPLQIERINLEDCDIWELDETAYRFDWKLCLKFALLHLFHFASIANLVAISLERMHATLCPSRHLFLKKWVYLFIIVVIWVTAAIREAIQIALMTHGHPELEMILNSTLYTPFYVIAVALICISYISIFVKIRRSPLPHPQRNGVINSERRITSTLFIVTVVSLLALLPVMIYLFVTTFIHPLRPYFHARMIVLVFFFGNSLANPIIYAMKMQGVRAGLVELFSRSTNHDNAATFPLRRN
ncbi:uncharacterized protein [Porites lutea]|uniref:uncharacterized protein n=1 Tax=Porites lutea TaxID=51062 RepID=UPI003CC6C727